MDVIKGIGCMVTGWLILMGVLLGGGAAYGYLTDSISYSQTAKNGLFAIYILALVVAIGWDIWLMLKGHRILTGATNGEHKVNQVSNPG